jgi:predicted peptidase
MKNFIILFWFIISQIALAEVRTWKTADGLKCIEAEFISTRDGEVTIKRKSDLRLFTLPISKLSAEDQAWIKTQKAETSIPAEVKEPDPALVKLITGKWERHEAHGMKFRIFGERKIRRSKNDTYPMVIYLHGRGNDVMTPEEPGNANTFTKESKKTCLVIAPQSLGNDGWKGSNADMALKIIDELIANFPIDQKRIYITGYSMGGFGTFEFLAMKPKLFAAGVTVAGGASPQNAQKLKDIPIWAFHGDADEAVKVESTRNIVEAIKKLNGKIKYTEIPGGDHSIANQVYQDQEMHKWLFEQKRAD